MWCRVSSGHEPMHERLRPAAQLHGVVGDEPVAADDEVERAFALADAALPDHEHAEAEDVHQHAVDDAACRQVGVEDADSRVIASGVDAVVRSSGTDAALGGVDDFRRRREAAGDEHARQVVAEDAVQRVRRAPPAASDST